MSYTPRRLVLDEPGLSIMRPDDRGFRDIGSAISAGASLLGAMNSSDAASSAADSQAASAAAATAEQRRQFDLTRQDQAPFLQTGTAANQRLAYLLGIGPKNASGPATTDQIQQLYRSIIGRDAMPHELAWQAANSPTAYDVQQNLINSPGPKSDGVAHVGLGNGSIMYGAPSAGGNEGEYGSLLKKFDQNDLNNDVVYQSGLKFGLDQGNNAINARAIANGGYDSGATLKALTQFGNDYGSTKANDAFNRYQTENANIFNKLAGVSGAGQTAANTVAQAGTNMANNVSNLMTDAGNARAAGIVGSANAWGSAAGGVTNAVNNYNSGQILQKLLARNNGYNPSFGGGSWNEYAQLPGQYSTVNQQYG